MRIPPFAVRFPVRTAAARAGCRPRGRMRAALALASVLCLLSRGLAAAGEEAHGTASAADQSSLAALIGKPVVARDGQPIGSAWDIILDPPGKPRLLVIQLRDTSRLVSVDFSAVGYHAARREIQVSRMAAADVAARGEFAYGIGMVSLKPHQP